MTGKNEADKNMALVPWEGCNKPIPAFLTQLPWAQTDDDAVGDIVERILRADTLEKVLERPGTVEFADLVATCIVIHGFKMMPSTIETGVGAYAVIDFTYDGNGEHQITTTSALGVLAQLAKAYQLSGFPLRCGVLEIDTGKNGKNNPLYLAPASATEAF